MSKWTKEQELAINETGTNIIVSAGAGSGKTAVLTERTIKKIMNGTNINNLLILTFTNAAASEMRERIRNSLKKAGLTEQLNYIDSSYITTFDSFMLSIVKKYHTTLSLSKNISIMDSSIEILKTNELIDYIFEKSYGDNDFNKLINDFCIKNDDNIKSVVKEVSKKLDLITNKKEFLDNYIDNFYSDINIDSYIDKYVNEVINVKNSINEYYTELKKYVDDKYLEKYNLELLLDSDDYISIKENLDNVGSPRATKDIDECYKTYKEKITTILKKLKELTRFESTIDMKESLLSTKPYVSSIIKIIKEFDELFLEYKKENNIYTFSDIALMGIKLVKENEDIRKEISNTFTEIMIDEYQDTSDIQEEFISLISNNNVYMVGDIKQSIYRFRNANPYIFRDKYDNYSKNIGGIKIDLLKNFRSRPEVLDNINLIFNLIMDSEIGDADYITSHQMNFGNTNYIDTLKTKHNNNMDILVYDKEEVEGFTSDEVEAFTVAYDIKEKILNKYQVADKETNTLRDCKYSDFAIIMDRGSSFDLYKKIFEYVGVPIVQIKNEKLTLGYDIIVLKNLLSLIIKINNCEFDDDFKYLFTSISRSFIFKISDEEIFDIVKNNNYSKTELFKLCSSINITEISNLELLNKVIDLFNIYEKLILLNNIEDAIIKIDYLKDLSINLSNIGYTPVMFVKYLDDMIKENTIEYSLNIDNQNSVKILNIHKSKGLEYNICYFTGLSKKSNDEDKKAKFVVDKNHNIITPFINDGIKQIILKDLLVIEEEKASISEKIRLFYVALTRAKEKMIIVSPLDKNSICYDTLVPTSIRLNYNRISDMLNSIICVLMPYIKDIDFDKVKLTRDYELKRNYNYKENIEKTNIKINNYTNNINYELINKSRFSKNTHELITKEDYNSMQFGKNLHYIFEVEDFKNTTNEYVLKFLKHINSNYIACYKEYEFIYNLDNEVKHGFIDLMLEYKDKIDIIDYKLKNIVDDNYIKQLNGYKDYIENLSNKVVNIYLYSIMDDKLEKIN